MNTIPLIRSKAAMAILAATHLDAEREFYLRELVRRTGMAPRTIQVQLDSLVVAGFLRERRDGNRRYVRAEIGHPLYAPLREIVLKTAGIVPMLREALRGAGDVSLAFVFGSIATGTSRADSDVDLFIVGGASLRSVVSRLRPVQNRLGREINPVVWTPEEFGDRRRRKDPFLTRIVASPRLMVVGTDNDLKGLAG